MSRPDIDIDVANRTHALQFLQHVAAANKDGKKHNTGIYLNPIPCNPFRECATINFEDAEELGYFKFDILNLSFYTKIQNREQLKQLSTMQPMWELLEHREFVEELLHLSNHYDLVRTLKPNSIDKLAATLAIIRPAKRYLENASWPQIFKEVWVPPTDGSYFFKKSHAYSYAMLVICQMNYLTLTAS